MNIFGTFLCNIITMASTVPALVSLVWLIFVLEALSEESELPSITCPNYFHYEPHGRGYIGKITLDDVPFSTLDVEVTFSQKQQIGTKERIKGRLVFEYDLITVQKDFEDGNPITFNVEFPLATEIPKLIRLKMNGEDICTASTPREHEVVYSFRRSFTPTEGTRRITKNTTLSTTATTEETSLESTDSIICGLSSFNEENVIHGQHNVTWGWSPWATRIYRRKDDIGSLFIVSGVLISSRTVITVVTAFTANDTAADILVQLGVLGLSEISNSYPQTRRVKTLLRHPQFGMSTYSDADVALLKLDQPVIFSRYILPICLWNEVDETKRFVGETGYVAFFLLYGSDQVINGTVISLSKCLQSNKKYIAILSERTFCVDYHNMIGPRYGPNGGSAFIMIRDGQWMLRGLYSVCIVVNGQCPDNLYFVYSDMAKVGTWIRENM